MTSEIVKTPSYPSWLNSDFFYTILRNNKHLAGTTDSLSIHSIHIEPATAVGDNYMSSIYRVLIEFSVDPQKEILEKLALIVKTETESEQMQEITEKYKAFPKEILLYSELIPAFEEIWEKAGHPVEFGPRHFFSSKTPRAVIVMDDIKARGYNMLSRQKGLNLDEVKVLLTKLSKFHSASVIYYDENGPYCDLLNEGILRMDAKDQIEPYYNTMYDSMMKMMENWDFAKPYLPKLRLWKNRIFNTAFQITQAEKDSFNVLNHGDVWTNNLMFKHTDGLPKILLVDYQLSSWASPAVDLIYLFVNALNTDELVKHFDKLIEFYHSELTRAFEILGKPQKIPLLEELQKDIYRKSFFVSIMMIESIPVLKLDPNIKMDLDAILSDGEEGEEMKRIIFYSDSTTDVYKKILPFFEEKGFLDISK